MKSNQKESRGRSMVVTNIGITKKILKDSRKTNEESKIFKQKPRAKRDWLTYTTNVEVGDKKKRRLMSIKLKNKKKKQRLVKLSIKEEDKKTYIEDLDISQQKKR
jgi:hypothetical protein